MVGYLDSAGGVTGSLVDPWHVLTAAHCVRGYTSGTFSLDLPEGRVSYPWTLDNVTIHPIADLAIITLPNPISMKGYDLFAGTNEAGQVAIIVGYGMSGVGNNVSAGGNPNYPRGTKRFGYNKIDSIVTGTTPLLATDYDAPTSAGSTGTLGASKEVMMGAGDSGGPTFISDNGTLKIAGIHSQVLDFNGNGKWPDYGDRGRDVRVSSYVSWIMSVYPRQGDADLDGAVNDTDLNILMESWGRTDALWAQGDFNGDRVVDALDLNLLLNSMAK